MDEPTLQIEKITGVPQKNVACGVFVGRITLQDDSLGTLVSCILAEGEQDNAGELLRDIFELSTKKLEGSQSGSLEAVKNASDACGQYVKERLSLKQQESKEQNKLTVSFALAFFYKSACYIARHSDKVKVFVFEPPKSLEITFEEGSGPLESSQIYLIATQKFLSIFDSSIFSEEQKTFDPQEIIDGLATEISARDDQSEIGAAFVLVKSEEPQEPKEIEEPGESEEYPKAVDTLDDQGKPERSKLGDFALKIRNPLPFILGIIGKGVREAKSLKGGDIKALFRLRRNIAAVAAVIVLLLIVSVIFTIGQKQQRERTAEFNSHLNQASSKYSEAQALLELNRSRAREILIEADKEIKLAQELVKTDEKAEKLAEDITNALKETEITENVNFVTLAELDQSADSLSVNGKKLVAITLGKIFEINPSDKSKNETDGPSDAKSGFVFDNKGFILTNDGVYRLNLADGKLEKILDVGNAFDISVFIGNVYLLGSNQVIKFSPIEKGYADGIDYLNEKIDFKSDSRMAIDGFVWLTNGQKILKFLRGENQNLEIQGLTAPIGQLGAIYTSASLDNLYVVDRANSALLVIDKDGIYKKAYQSGEFKRASDLVVNEDEDTVYLAVGTQILEAKLE